MRLSSLLKINGGGYKLEKILLINDSVFENVVMRDMLENLGHEVQTSNEFDAYGALEQFKPDVVIANLIMRKITGDILLGKMKNENPNLKTILSSSNEVMDKDLKAKKIDAFIKIPVKRENIEKVLLNFRRFVVKKAPAKIKFCTECGGDLRELSASSKFCAFCGYKL